MADKVMHMPSSETLATNRAYNQINHDAVANSENKTIQLKELPSATATKSVGHSLVDSTLRSTSQPLDKTTRSFFEPRFGYDLSSIRIHTGSDATTSANALGARAYTLGSSIVFGSGEFAPATAQGKHLLAHELAHTIQQNNSPDTLHRKIAVNQGVDLKPLSDNFQKEGDYFTYPDPIRDKSLDLEILTSMLHSPRIFKIKGASNDEAKLNLIRHINARQGVVELAKNKKYAFIAGEAGFRMNKKYWTWGNGKFKSKPGVDLNEARADIGVNPQEYAIGCAAATQLTVKGGGQSESTNVTASEPRDWVPGESGYIKNKLWNGGDNGLQGEIIIYVGAKRFWGHYMNEVSIKPYVEWLALVNRFNQTPEEAEKNNAAELSTDRTYPDKGLET